MTRLIRSVKERSLHSPLRKAAALWVVVAGLAVLAVGVTGVCGAYLLLHASLPKVEGHVALPGLEKPVVVVTSHLGVPTIQAADSLDAWRILGYVEAQNRFFQMDVLRRLGGGDLAALLGKSAVQEDLRRSRFGFRKAAERVYLDASPQQKARLEAFSLGVNEGLQELATKPWPYWVLGASPRPWKPSDCILVMYALGFMLHSPWNEQKLELSLLHLRTLYSGPVLKFLMSPDEHWSAPLIGTVPAPASVPGAAQINLANSQARLSLPLTLPRFGGSTAIAVAGLKAAHGQALVAAAPTLTLTNPPLWYRAKLMYQGSTKLGRKVVLSGIFIPGVPFMMAGSNGYIAWSLTNVGGDWTDLVKTQIQRHGTPSYETPSGSQVLTNRQITIHVRGAKPVRSTVSTTVWGPIIGWSRPNQAIVVHWALDQPGAMNLAFMRLGKARTVSSALAIAQTSGIPEENFVVADHKGNIGWTIAGRIPRRISGCNYSIPESWSNGKCGWKGWLGPRSYPVVVNPKDGYLVVGQNRTDARKEGAVLGLIHFSDGAGVREISSELSAQIARGHDITPEKLLHLQLDEKSLFMERWKKLALSILRPSALKFHRKRQAFRQQLVHWSGQASEKSVGYRLVRDFRLYVAEAVFAPILGKLQRHYPDEGLPFLLQMEGPLWALVSKRPKNWLNSRFPNWNSLFLYAIDHVIAKLWSPDAGFSRALWGNKNQVAFGTPFKSAWGILAPWVSGPRVGLPGGRYTPRVQIGNFGASYRIVVAPGNKTNDVDILEISGGQTDNPLSTWYRAGLRTWITGKKEAVKSGKNPSRLRFIPSPF